MIKLIKIAYGKYIHKDLPRHSQKESFCLLTLKENLIEI